MNPNICKLPIASLIIDADYQPRTFTGADGDLLPVKSSHVAALTHSDVEHWPPITVTDNGDGTYTVIDGMHRVAAAERLGLPEIEAVIETGAGYDRAFELNMSHGMPISVSDRKDFARWLHEQEPELSLREIGRRTGLSHHTVSNALSGGLEGGRPAQPDTPTKAARRLVGYVDKLWRSRGLLDTHPTRTLGTALAQAAVNLWGGDAEKMLGKLAAILASAQEQIE